MTADPFDLHGSASLVTGASSGIGAEIARALAAAGSSVMLVGRSPQRLGDVVDEIVRAGGRADSVAVDLCADDAPQAVVDAVRARFGALDVLVHSAGIYAPASLADTTDDLLDAQWAINVRAPFRLTRTAVPEMSPGGSIVFVSSISGHVGSPNDAAYCASKGAIELVVKALAVELAPAGLRVNAVAPGNVHTPLNEALITPAVERDILAMTPAGRIGVVTDIGPAVVFLASRASSYVHGVSLLVDGGLVAQ